MLRKKTYLLFIFFVLAYLTYSQGLIINGGQMVMLSGANVVLSANSNWTNNATANCQTGSWVRFTGNARQNILGSSYTTFSNVDINNSHADGVWVGKNIGINNNLQMTLGCFNLRDYVVTFGTTASVTGGETNTKRIRATNAAGAEGLGTGYIVTTRSNPSGNVANLGLSVNLTGAAVELRRGHERQQGTGTFTGNYSVYRYYEIRGTTFAGTNVTFHECFDAERHVHGTNNYIFYQWLSTSVTLSPQYWSPIPDNTSGYSLSITRTLQNSSLNWTRVTLGSLLQPLPVMLLTFTATCSDGQAKLFWQTASETNSYYFTIWRSDNGIDYYAIGNTYAVGYSNNVQSYFFTDDTFINGTAYYRLTQTDMNNSSAEVGSTVVNCKEQSFFEDFTIFRGNGHFVINIQGTPGNIYKLNFTNVLGQLFYVSTHLLTENFLTLNLDDSGFAAGMYFVTLESSNGRITKQIVVSF